METEKGKLLLDLVAALEKETFPDFWTRESLKDTMGYSCRFLLTAWENKQERYIISAKGGEDLIETGRETDQRGLSDGVFLGYLLGSSIGEESELLRIAVRNSARRSGVGNLLMTRYFEEMKEAESFFLEVRESNHAARALYEKMGYQKIDVRKDYYSGPKENGIIYRRDGLGK